MGMCERKGSGQGAIYLLHQPVDNGIGVRVDYYSLRGEDSDKITPGLYHSLSYGGWGLYKLYGVGHHVKLSSGVLLLLPVYGVYPCALSAGVNYHHIYGGVPADLRVNPRILKPWSYEAGVSVYMKRLAISVNTDLPRWEPCIGIGIVF